MYVQAVSCLQLANVSFLVLFVNTNLVPVFTLWLIFCMSVYLISPSPTSDIPRITELVQRGRDVLI